MAQPTVPRTRRMVLAMKSETTYGVDVLGGSYVAADIVPASNIQPTLQLEEIENLSVAGDLGRTLSAIGMESGGVSFSMFLRGAGSAYSASVKPEADLPLRGCGLGATGAFGLGTENWKYQPSSTFESMTIYVVQENGPAVKLVGCFGTVDFTLRAGAVVEARFSFLGLIGGVAAVTYVEGSIAGTPQYPVAKSALFQIGTENYAPRIAAIGLSVANQMQRIPSINAAGGLVGYMIADRNPRLTIDPEADTIANYDWFGKWKASTLADCTFQAGATQYVRLKFNLPKLQIVQQGRGSRDGLTSFPTTLLATLGAGNDDFDLVFD